MPSAYRFSSPSRRWRALSMAGLAVVLAAGWAAMYASSYDGPYSVIGHDPASSLVFGGAVCAGLAAYAVLTLRARLVIDDGALTDRRMVRTVRVPWEQVAAFRVGRPGGPWSGYCVIAECRGRGEIDLLSTQSYARHIAELNQLCDQLEYRRAARRGAGN